MTTKHVEIDPYFRHVLLLNTIRVSVTFSLLLAYLWVLVVIFMGRG
jgi:hypothetical protein